MESSKRAVEAYLQTRLIDPVIVDNDEVAPAYRLDELCSSLRSSPSDMVQEMVEYAMRRLRSRSPRIKQKVLRMIKYCARKGGPQFKRQMQRQSAAVRCLFDYKGYPDPLRGDALNKAVRDMAHEAITAIFSPEDDIPLSDHVTKRIMGFGSSNYEMPREGKNSSIGDVVTKVVGLGSVSIRQGLNMINGYLGGDTENITNSPRAYRGPSLGGVERETMGSSGREEQGQIPSKDSRANFESSIYSTESSDFETSNGRGEANNGKGASMEGRLLDSITASGTMRIQPTRESLEAFLASALKLDLKNLSHELDLKLRSDAWQTRFKALCVLEAMLHQRNIDFFRLVVHSLEQDASGIHSCTQSLQTSVQEKAKKVLLQLAAVKEHTCDDGREGSKHVKHVDHTPLIHAMPDLIDTRDLVESSKSNLDVLHPVLSDAGLKSLNAIQTDSNDLFAGVSFYPRDNAVDQPVADLFDGLSIENKELQHEERLDLLANSYNTERDTLSIVRESLFADGLVDALKNAPVSHSGNDNLFKGINLNGATTSAQAVQEGCSLFADDGLLGTLKNAPVSHSGNDKFFKGLDLNSATASVQAVQEGSCFPKQALGSLPSFQMMHQSPIGVLGGFGASISMPQDFWCGKWGVGVESGCNFQGYGRVSRSQYADGFDYSGDATSHCCQGTDYPKMEDSKAFDFISDHLLAVRGARKVS